MTVRDPRLPRVVWEGFVEPPLEYVRVSLTKTMRMSSRVIVEKRVLENAKEGYWEHVDPHDPLYTIAVSVALLELQLKDRT